VIPKEKLAKGLDVFFAYYNEMLGIVVSKRTVHSVAKKYITVDGARGDRFEHDHFSARFHLTVMEALRAFIAAVDRNVESLRSQAMRKEALAGRARAAAENTHQWRTGKSGNIYLEKLEDK
jgi:hypothetical protein